MMLGLADKTERYSGNNGYAGGSSNGYSNNYSNGGGYGASTNGYSGGGGYGGGGFGGVGGDKMSNLGAGLKTQHWGPRVPHSYICVSDKACRSCFDAEI